MSVLVNYPETLVHASVQVLPDDERRARRQHVNDRTRERDGTRQMFTKVCGWFFFSLSLKKKAA